MIIDLPPNRYSTLVQVDRSVRPAYPDWVLEVLHPELEATGPPEYDLSTVDLWRHDRQRGGGVVESYALYRYLRRAGRLAECLGLADGEEIAKKDVELFRRLFSSNVLFLLRSVVRDKGDRLNVACLSAGSDAVVLRWNWLDIVQLGSSRSVPRIRA